MDPTFVVVVVGTHHEVDPVDPRLNEWGVLAACLHR